MADNITLNAGSGGVTLKTDENASSEHYQVVKLADGTADSDTVIASGNGVASGALRVTMASDSTGVVSLATGANTIGTANIGTASTAAGGLAKAEDTAHSTGDVGVFSLSRRVDTTPTSSAGTSGDYAAFNTDANGCLWVAPYGNVAHDAADSGNPVKVGAKAVSPDGTAAGNVAEGDRTDLKTDLNGRLLVSDVAPEYVHATTVSAAASTVELIAAPGASHRIFITDVVVSAAGAQQIKFVEDTGAAVDIIETLDMAANTTVNLHFRTPIPVTANKNFGYTTAQTASTGITVTGYIADV